MRSFAGVLPWGRYKKRTSAKERQFDPKSEYFDKDSKRDDPRWSLVDIAFVETFAHPVTLDEMKSMPALKNMVLLKRGRLSVQPVTAAEWAAIVKRGRG